MKALGILLALFVGLSAHAEPGDYHIITHGFSYHTVPRPSDPQWNQVNPGHGIRYELNDTVSIQAGFYKNSYYRNSVYAGVDWTPLDLKIPDVGSLSTGRLQMGGFIGLASGYTDKAGVAGGGLVRWQGQKFSLAVRIVPAKCTIFALEMGYKF